MFKYIVNFANGIGRMHGRIFMWIGKKAESNPWWSAALTLWALYEIVEHVAGPVMAIMAVSGHLVIK